MPGEVNKNECFLSGFFEQLVVVAVVDVDVVVVVVALVGVGVIVANVPGPLCCCCLLMYKLHCNFLPITTTTTVVINVCDFRDADVEPFVMWSLWLQMLL